MQSPLSIILVVIATIINSVVFGYVASNTKNNKTNRTYLIFLSFILSQSFYPSYFNRVGLGGNIDFSDARMVEARICQILDIKI